MELTLAEILQSVRKAERALQRCIDNRKALIIVTCCQGESVFTRLPPEIKDEIFGHVPGRSSLKSVVRLPLQSFFNKKTTLEKTVQKLKFLEEKCGMGRDVRMQAIAEISGDFGGDEQEKDNLESSKTALETACPFGNQK